MCLGVPGKLIEIDEACEGVELRTGVVDFGGVRKEICLACLPDASCGDYVIVHVGFAIARVNPEEAERVFRYLDDIGEIENGQSEDPLE